MFSSLISVLRTTFCLAFSVTTVGTFTVRILVDIKQPAVHITDTLHVVCSMFFGKWLLHYATFSVRNWRYRHFLAECLIEKEALNQVFFCAHTWTQTMAVLFGVT